MITCRELTAFLDEYVDGSLPADRRAVFEAHLAACPDCQNFLASYRAAVRLVKEAAERVPSGVPAGLVAAVLKAGAANRIGEG